MLPSTEHRALIKEFAKVSLTGHLHQEQSSPCSTWPSHWALSWGHQRMLQPLSSSSLVPGDLLRLSRDTQVLFRPSYNSLGHPILVSVLIRSYFKTIYCFDGGQRTVMCWNVMMAVTVCGDHLRHPSNVLTRRGSRHHTTLAPHWSRVRPAGLWLAGCWPRGHTRTRDTGTCDLVLTRHLHLQPHSPHTGNMANIRSPTLKLCIFERPLHPNPHQPAHTAPHLHHFLRPLLSSAASKCSKLDQKPEMECG